jgi:epoxyqueuosine reductase QueG
LGGIITDAELEYNREKEPDRCRTCTECQKACPMGALDQSYVLKVNACMSYLLGEECLSMGVLAAMENRIGDCELCQEACPWNRKHLEKPLATSLAPKLQSNLSFWKEAFYLPKLIAFSETQYEAVFGRLGTGIPFPTFQRNVRLALKRAEEIAHQGR